MQRTCFSLSGNFSDFLGREHFGFPIKTMPNPVILENWKVESKIVTVFLLSTVHTLLEGFPAMSMLVLPGDKLPPEILPIPSNPSAALKLGPGLRYIPPSTVTPVHAGPLCVDKKKNAIWVENNNGRV